LCDEEGQAPSLDCDVNGPTGRQEICTRFPGNQLTIRPVTISKKNFQRNSVLFRLTWYVKHDNYYTAKDCKICDPFTLRTELNLPFKIETSRNLFESRTTDNHS